MRIARKMLEFDALGSPQMLILSYASLENLIHEQVIASCACTGFIHSFFSHFFYQPMQGRLRDTRIGGSSIFNFSMWVRAMQKRDKIIFSQKKTFGKSDYFEENLWDLKMCKIFWNIQALHWSGKSSYLHAMLQCGYGILCFFFEVSRWMNISSTSVFWVIFSDSYWSPIFFERPLFSSPLHISLVHLEWSRLDEKRLGGTFLRSPCSLGSPSLGSSELEWERRRWATAAQAWILHSTKFTQTLLSWLLPGVYFSLGLCKCNLVSGSPLTLVYS